MKLGAEGKDIFLDPLLKYWWHPALPKDDKFSGDEKREFREAGENMN